MTPRSQQEGLVGTAPSRAEGRPSRPTHAPVVFRAVGDICPGDTAILGLGVCSTTRKFGASYPFTAVTSLLRGADVAVGNLEGILSRRMEGASRPDLTFCGEPSLAEALRDAGFTGLTVANNHAFEHGQAYFEETVCLLREAGLQVFGLRDPSGRFHCQPVVVDVRGCRIGVLAYNWVSVDRFPAADDFIAQVHDAAVNYTWNRTPDRDRARRADLTRCNAAVLSDIRTLRPSVDHLVVLPHWGFEFVHVPPICCVLEGASFVDAGADLVVGTHPHVVQGYERHGSGDVFFSTGNFLFNHFRKRPSFGAVLTYHLGSAGPTPFRFDYTAQGRSFQVVPANADDAARMSEIVESSNAAIVASDRERALDDDRLYADFERVYRRKKLRTIWTHLRLAVRHPFVARTVTRKMRSLGGLILRRLQGERIRW